MPATSLARQTAQFVPKRQRCGLAADFRFDRIACKQPANTRGPTCSSSAHRGTVRLLADRLVRASNEVQNPEDARLHGEACARPRPSGRVLVGDCERGGGRADVAGRTGPDRQHAVGDLAMLRWRLQERAGSASAERRPLLHLPRSGQSCCRSRAGGCFCSRARAWSNLGATPAWAVDVVASRVGVG
jgi:hypothetical protein